jgi:hypothetical protein
MPLPSARGAIKSRLTESLRSRLFLSVFPAAAPGQAPGARIIDYFACVRVKNVEKDLQQQ